MIAIPVNQTKINAIKRKSVRKTRKITRQTHHRANILIRPKIVIKDANNVRLRAIGKGSDKIMHTFNGKVADNII